MPINVSAGSGVQPRRTARDLVADHLRQAILREELAQGEKLSVGEIATTLGVSHTPTREAFQLLAGEGLVRLSAYRGAFVAELSADEYEEIMLMRIPLEGLAAQLGAERIDDEGIQRMGEMLEDLAEASAAGDIDRFIEIDRGFHAVHYLASGREGLWDRIISLRRAAERYTRRGYQLPGIGLEDTVKSHRRLFAAVRDHDGEKASEEIRTDLAESRDVIYADVLAREAGRVP